MLSSNIPRDSERFYCSHLHIPRDSIAATGSVAFMQYSQRQRSNDRFYYCHLHIPRDTVATADSIVLIHIFPETTAGSIVLIHIFPETTVGSIVLIHIFPETVYTYPRAGHEPGTVVRPPAFLSWHIHTIRT